MIYVSSDERLSSVPRIACSVSRKCALGVRCTRYAIRCTPPFTNRNNSSIPAGEPLATLRGLSDGLPLPFVPLGAYGAGHSGHYPPLPAQALQAHRVLGCPL